MKNVCSCPFVSCDKDAGVEDDEDSEDVVEYEEEAVAGGGGKLSNPSRYHDVVLPLVLVPEVEDAEDMSPLI